MLWKPLFGILRKCRLTVLWLINGSTFSIILSSEYKRFMPFFLISVYLKKIEDRYYKRSEVTFFQNNIKPRYKQKMIKEFKFGMFLTENKYYYGSMPKKLFCQGYHKGVQAIYRGSECRSFWSSSVYITIKL